MKILKTQIDEVLHVLNKAEFRCTYNALAEYCGADLRSIINCLGDRRPMASWIVNRNSMKPTGYLPRQEHENLYKKSTVILSCKELEDLLSRYSNNLSSAQFKDTSTPIPAADNDGVHCYGVDGCRGGWIYALASDQRVSFGTVVRLEDLVGKVVHESRIFVDIPIGLRDDLGDPRLCDKQARRLLRPLRTSSVFNAPLREILEIDNYGEANDTSKRLCGKGLSKQSFNITPKIREVDQLMTGSEKARGLIREVHPEVCFYGLAGGKPMQHSKKTKEGFDERLKLLVRYQPGVESAVEAALSHYPRKTVAADDILDALVCAVTARMRDKWMTVPRVPEVDSKGLQMEMVYCQL